jgi:hypothetical protein
MVVVASLVMFLAPLNAVANGVLLPELIPKAASIQSCLALKMVVAPATVKTLAVWSAIPSSMVATSTSSVLPTVTLLREIFLFYI